jgi:hypothetical protein
MSSYKRMKVKTGGSKSLSHTATWSGGRGYLRRGTRRKNERFESRGRPLMISVIPFTVKRENDT